MSDMEWQFIGYERAWTANKSRRSKSQRVFWDFKTSLQKVHSYDFVLKSMAQNARGHSIKIYYTDTFTHVMLPSEILNLLIITTRLQIILHRFDCCNINTNTLISHSQSKNVVCSMEVEQKKTLFIHSGLRRHCFRTKIMCVDRIYTRCWRNDFTNFGDKFHL